MSGPVGCVAAVTYRCNSRCEMCDIWKQGASAESELAPSDYEWLPRSLRSINVSGGEPFLRDDIVEVVGVMRATCPGARIVISTNGLTPSRIEQAVLEMGPVAVRVSVDGVGAIHDRIRGIEGAYARAMETVDRLMAAGVSDLGLAATATESNPGELTRVKKKADELGVKFTMSAAHSSPIFFGEHEAERPRAAETVRELGAIMRERLASARPTDWARAYYARGLIDYVEGRRRRLACKAGTDFFFLDPLGDVYPCNIHNQKMGNVRDGSFDEIRRASEEEIRPAVEGCEEQCWMVCTVAPPMIRRPLKPAAWMVAAKFLGLDRNVGR